MANPLPSLLLSLGFTQKEADVYLAVEKHGRIVPADLAEATGINRTTVYSVTKELLARGVIVEDLGSSSRELLATAPEELQRLLERELAEVKQKQSIVDEAVEMVRDIAGEALFPVPKIQYVKEDRIEAFLYDRTPVWNDSMVKGDGSYLGFQEAEFVGKFEEWIDWYWKRAPEKIQLRLLAETDTEAESRVSSKGYKQREIVFWKTSVDFTATTWVMGEYVVMFVLSSSPNYLVEIHDARFAENQRSLFEAILEDVDAKRVWKKRL